MPISVVVAGRAQRQVFARTGVSANVGRASLSNATVVQSASAASFAQAVTPADQPAALIEQPASWGTVTYAGPTITDVQLGPSVVEVS